MAENAALSKAKTKTSMHWSYVRPYSDKSFL